MDSIDKDYILADNMFSDNPDFVDISQEFEDDCGDACKIWSIK